MSSRRSRRGRNISGIVVLDKEAGLSSNAALQSVKRLYAANKAGHTGTLDPLATGVLPLCLGEATKISGFLLNSDKGYWLRIKLGVRTSTGDRDGDEIAGGSASAVEGLKHSDIRKALRKFEGEIEQLPPMHSAVKIGGVPLYKRAHRGESVERTPRKVSVHRIELSAFAGDEAEIDIACSKGTYIRVIADDLGQLLGCGAHVIALRRTRAGTFTEQDCVSASVLEEERNAGGLAAIDRLLVPMDRAIEDLPPVNLPAIAAGQIRNGQAVLVRHLPEQGLVRLYEDERFIGIGCIDDDGKVAPRRLLVNH